MGLDGITRGVLEKAIDKAIEMIPRELRDARRLKNKLMLAKEEDFVLGITLL